MHRPMNQTTQSTTIQASLWRRLKQSVVRNPLAIGLLVYLFSTAPVLLGVFFGMDFVRLANPRDLQRPHFLDATSRFDGWHYKEITEVGYSYNEKKRSTVAFFPAYPLLGCLVRFFTGWSPALALLVVSNVMLATTFAALYSFLRARWPDAASGQRHLALALVAIFPTAFFYRMVYSESTFLFAMTLFLIGITRRWPLLVLAFLAGTVTAIRSVGVACTAAFVWYVLFDVYRGPLLRRVRYVILCLPLACWGLLAYMAYQEAVFGNPLAFAQTQEHWRVSLCQDHDFWDKAEALLNGDPIFDVYDPYFAGYWRGRGGNEGNPLFSLIFWNPILFVGTFILVVFGWGLRWLTGPEAILGFALLAIPYFTRAYENSMYSHARFAAIVLPAYLVAGKLIQPLPRWTAWAILGIFSVMIMAWSALFAAVYGFF